MIGKKMLMWIGAGVLSVASIPAIGATVSHRAKTLHHKPVAVTHHVATRLSTKRVKPTVLAMHHTKKLTAGKKSTVHAKATSHGTIGVLAMHSGHATLAKPIVHKTVTAKKPVTHLLAATSKVKLPH